MLQWLSGIFSGMGFVDVLDILIVAFAVYKLLGFIHSSRAAQLAKGLLFIIAIYFVADAFDFYTVSWLLENLLSIGLIALIVIFQPELRRGLEFMGRGKLGAGKNSIMRDEIADDVEMIVRAISYFSARKEGAIIVIERDTALSEYAENGTIINADLSEQLLENIFYKGSPLHDGAVILRGERIYAAGCVLPLTENTGLSKDLGTRHRAGIGITEVSDALVLIVSEETGIISIASDGKLSRFLDLKTVEKTLLNYYMSKLDRPNFGTAVLNKIFGKDSDEQNENN